MDNGSARGCEGTCSALWKVSELDVLEAAPRRAHSVMFIGAGKMGGSGPRGSPVPLLQLNTSCVETTSLLTLLFEKRSQNAPEIGTSLRDKQAERENSRNGFGRRGDFIHRGNPLKGREVFLQQFVFT